jgi:hypothetical protein
MFDYTGCHADVLVTATHDTGLFAQRTRGFCRAQNLKPVSLRTFEAAAELD